MIRKWNQQFLEQNINKWAKFIKNCQKIWIHDFEVLKATLVPTEVADRKLNNDFRVLSPAPHQKAVRCHLRGRRGLPSWHWLWRWAGPPGPPPPSLHLIHAPGYACQNWGSHWANDLLSMWSSWTWNGCYPVVDDDKGYHSLNWLDMTGRGGNVTGRF